jgi:hypothetical protein
MAESDELFAEVAKLRDEVDEQGLMLDALVRSSGIGDQLVARIAEDDVMKAILLEVDGEKSQAEIANGLKSRGLGASEATVSRRIDVLTNDLGLIALSHRGQTGKVYHRTRLDSALKVSRRLGK